MQVRYRIAALVFVLIMQPVASYFMVDQTYHEVTGMMSYIYPLLIALFMGGLTAWVFIPLLARQNVNVRSQLMPLPYYDRMLVGIAASYLVYGLFVLSWFVSAMLP